MDIKFDSPVKFSMEILEFDERTPSMKVSIGLEVRGFKYGFSVVTTLWLECDAFDEFLSALKRRSASILVDMERAFELKIDFSEGSLVWNVSEADLNGGSSLIKGKRPISDDELACLVGAFDSYPKWW
jgi:hypothetical protein